MTIEFGRTLGSAAPVNPHQVIVDGRGLTPADVLAVASAAGTDCRLSATATAAVGASYRLRRDLVGTGVPIYGVSTGFGDSVGNHVAAEKTARLQRNMVQYHRNGTGPAAPDDVVRATLLIRANCLARGNSGVSPQVLARLLDMVRHDVLPLVPERGSVGASGDLVPLSYVASAVIGQGRVRHRGVEREAEEVFTELGLPPVVLEAKDGLALLNGTSFSSALATLAYGRARRLAVLADVCTALATEALLGNQGHFGPFIHEHKPHLGQVASARVIRRLLHGSRLALPHEKVVDLNEELDGRGFQRLRRRIQDHYSIRCAPHVTGVLRDTLAWVGDWLRIEVNSSNDNPLFEAGAGIVHSGGNFYAGHVVAATDALRTAVANVADLLDRQLELLVDEKFNNGLTANLIAAVPPEHSESGLHHGFKGMQITCSALTAEVLHSCMPVSVFSRSTEAHNQDKVSMAPISARGAYTACGLVAEVAAIHLLAACQALDLRGTDRLAPRTAVLHRLVREHVPFVATDRRMDKDIETVVGLINAGQLTDIGIPDELPPTALARRGPHTTQE